MSQELYERLAEEEAGRRDAMLEASVRQSLSVAPDGHAKIIQLSRSSGLPVSVVERNQATVEARQRAQEIADLVSRSPILGAQLRNPQFAKIAHDDVENLGQVENVLKEWRGPKPTVGSYLSGIVKAVPQGFRAASSGLSAQIADAFDAAGVFPKDEVLERERQRKLAQATGAAAYTTPDFETSTAAAVYGGVTSTLQQIPGLAMSVATRNPAPSLATIGLTTQGQSYAKYRGRGGQPGESFVAATGEGAVEVGTELLPMSFLTKQLGRTGAKEFIVGLLARELPTEQLATVLQDAIDTAVANPDKTWEQYRQERPEAAYQTLISTLTQSAIMGGGHAALKRLGQKKGEAEQVQDDTTVKDLVALAEANKVLERDTETFETFAQSILEEGQENLWVPAEVLLQSNMVEQIVAGSPEIAAQIEDARVTGADIRIPTAEFLGRMVKDGTAQTLIEHVKTDPNGMSATEAKEYIAEHGKELESEVERVLAKREGEEAEEVSRETVRADIEAKLNATQRFTPDVHKANSVAMASFFATQAKRLGTTPEALYREFEPRFTAQTGEGKVFDQASTLQEVKDAWDAAKIDHSLFEKNGRIDLAKIAVPKESRKQGVGTDAMQRLIAYADATGQQIVLSPATDFGATSKSRLIDFYKRFGFVENRGRNKDFTTQETMIREPQKTLKQSQTPTSRETIELRKRESVLESLLECL